MSHGDFGKLFRLLCIALLSGIFPLTATSVYASSFKVNPLTFTLDQNTKAAVLKLTNTSNKDVTVQLESKRWTQDSKGEDVYEDTPDIIFFPKIVKIQKDEERIVRIGFRGALPTRHEISYRLFAQELPSQGGNTTFKFAFRFSMPIFIMPKIKTMAKEKLRNALVRDSELHVMILNSGSSHFVVKKITVVGIDNSNREVFTKEGNGWYVLPNVTRDFRVRLDEAQCRQSSSLNVELASKTRTMKINVPVDPKQCIAIKKPDNKLKPPVRKS